MVALKCLHELIEEQTRRSPQSVAVAFEGERLTYGELDRRAGRLAHRLRELGARPDVPIGIFVERSLEMIVAMLAVLKAGAPYMPIDTAYPQERIAFMLADAGAALLVSQRDLAPTHGHAGLPVLYVDDFDWQGPAQALHTGVTSANLAYVIYTSGSTGRPKGVAVEHRNIVNYVLGVSERLELEPGMRHATVSTIAADLGNTVIFPALVTGGCLHVVSQERAQSQSGLAEYFRRERIDVLKIVPSHLAALQSAGNPHDVMPARRLILGGEPSRLDWVERLRAVAPGCEIFNHYGPTETTVGVLTYRVPSALPSTPSGTLPLGGPLPGSRIYILDEHGRPVPEGEKGELCIGGGGVARGYLNRPDLTAQKFVPDPFSDEPGARMYRTGDLVRALPSGDVEFCGRIDHQVKVHGYRVELGEIEAALREHGGVAEAVVLAREDDFGERRLAAFVAPAATHPVLFAEELNVGMLREHLKARLPAYMVPSAFVLMQRLPLNANGKIDRQALARLPLEAPRAAGDVIAPRSDTEKALAAIWADLLKVEALGVHDDVFDLGAHSLMAMKALARIRERFDLNLALRNLFEHPTVARLAELIDGAALLRVNRAVPDADDREEVVL